MALRVKEAKRRRTVGASRRGIGGRGLGARGGKIRKDARNKGAYATEP